jgi:hypothetical protein
LINARQTFWISTIVMINAYLLLSFGVGYFRFLEGNDSINVFAVWLIIALLKVAMNYLYFRATKRSVLQFGIATLVAIIARLVFGVSFLMVILSFQFFVEFNPVSGATKRRVS